MRFLFIKDDETAAIYELPVDKITGPEYEVVVDGITFYRDRVISEHLMHKPNIYERFIYVERMADDNIINIVFRKMPEMFFFDENIKGIEIET